MSFELHPIVETERGVYQPSPWWLECGLLGGLFAVIVVGFSIGRIRLGIAVFYGLLTVLMFALRLRRRRKHGPLGPPLAAVMDQTLRLALPGDTRGAMTIVLADLEKLIIYGPTRRRTYRLLRRDGSFVEAVPLWSARVETRVIAFLQRALPSKVTVTEPQTLFASIRGDGP